MHRSAHRVDIKESDVNGVTPRRLLLIIFVQLIVDLLDLGQHHLLGVGKLNLWKLAFFGWLHIIGGEVDSNQLGIALLVSIESCRIVFVLLQLHNLLFVDAFLAIDEHISVNLGKQNVFVHLCLLLQFHLLPAVRSGSMSIDVIRECLFVQCVVGSRENQARFKLLRFLLSRLSLHCNLLRRQLFRFPRLSVLVLLLLFNLRALRYFLYIFDDNVGGYD